MKKRIVRKVKWNNVITIVLTMLSMFCIVEHIKLNGFYEGLITEIIMSLIIIVAMRFIVEDLQTNEFKFSDLFKD